MSAKGRPERELLSLEGPTRSAKGAPVRATCARPGRAAVALACAFLLQAATASAGPVLVYREGEACPRGRPADAPRISAAQAVERAKALLPKDFCGPGRWVSGCEFDPEWAYDTWRVFAQQYVL